MNYSSLLYGPIYRVQGVDAVLHIGGEDHDVRAMDKTGGLELHQGALVVETISVAAIVRATELASLHVDPGELDGGQITMNGATWNIASHRSRPSPKGQGDGEWVLILEDLS